MTAPRIHVTAAIVERQGRILIARRDGGRMAGKWEFPGGKVEPGETPEQCLAREIREELGAEVRVGALLASAEHDYEHICIRLDGYLCEWTAGAFRPGADHSEIAWVLPEALLEHDLAPADLPLVRALLHARQRL